MGGFLYWWQHLPESMDPVLFTLGPLRVQWYGLMYIIAFTVTYFLARRRTRLETRFRQYDEEFLKNILTYAFIGVLLGGRLGYVLFYNLPYYLAHPLEIIIPFSFDGGFHFTGISGMSYHGGVTGAILGSLLFSLRYKHDFWNLCDLFAPVIPLGYTFGRLGNFINGELWGRVTQSPIGMYFPMSPEGRRAPPSLPALRSRLRRGIPVPGVPVVAPPALAQGLFPGLLQLRLRIRALLHRVLPRTGSPVGSGVPGPVLPRPGALRGHDGDRHRDLHLSEVAPAGDCAGGGPTGPGTARTDSERSGETVRT